MPLHIKDVSLYTTKDVAYRLGIAEGTVRKYLREGKLIGRKHAGAWHVTAESFRAFLNQQGDDLRPDDVPQMVIQIEIDEPHSEPTPPRVQASTAPDGLSFPRPAPPGVDELHWLISEAQYLKERARRLEQKFGASDNAK
jgi:hypothetical protein